MPGPPRTTQQERADSELALGRAPAREETRSGLRPAAAGGPDRLRALARGAGAEVLPAAPEEHREYARLRAAPSSSGEPAPTTGRAPGWAGVSAVAVPIMAGASSLPILMFKAVDDRPGLSDALATASPIALVAAVAAAVAGAAAPAVAAPGSAGPNPTPRPPT
ncbi:hypothetical protein ACFV6F_01635 [Kitasatospora phosalacinea]|uniref:hypothetical protein n=1 Tax=Kitasatospora phosalacinea TaxID=2065 RepID=UPI0036530FFF